MVVVLTSGASIGRGRLGQVASSLTLHSGGLGFKPHPGARLPQLTSFMVFPTSSSRMMDWRFKLNLRRFVFYHLQLIIKSNCLLTELNRP
jgi:hypothetical protein